jgi:hypothetical protein
MAVGSENVRSFYRLHVNFPLARRALGPNAYLAQATALANSIGWWGGMAMQMKVDPRDGVPKLMEINPRIGEVRWQLVASGITEPWLSLKLARGETVEAVKSWPAGTMFLCPVEDVISLWITLLDLLVYKVRAGFGAESLSDPLNPPMGVRELLNSYKQTYLDSKRKVYNLYSAIFSLTRRRVSLGGFRPWPPCCERSRKSGDEETSQSELDNLRAVRSAVGFWEAKIG